MAVLSAILEIVKHLRRLNLKSLKRKILQKSAKLNNLAKVSLVSNWHVTNNEKHPQMFSLACNLTKNNVEFFPIEISSKKVRGNNADFSSIKITSKKGRGKNVGIATSKITSKLYVETTCIFRSQKLHRKKYVVITWISRLAKLHWNYMEM